MSDAKKTKAELIHELEDLRRAETRYRNFIENVEDACWEMDLRGHWTFLNKKVGDIIGYDEEKALGMSHRAYTSAETAEKVFRLFSEIYRTGEPATILDYEVIRPDGEIRHLDLSATLIRDKAGRPAGFRGIARDVTEFRKLFKAQKRSKIFLDNVEDACWELNLVGDIVFCNEAMWRRVGCTLEEILAPGYRKREMPPEDYKILQRHFEEVYQTGLPRTGIKTSIHYKDGSLKHIEMSISLIRDHEGHPSGFRGISRDTTEREKAEEEQIRFRKFLDDTEDCCFEIDLDGRYLYLNNAHYTILGYSVEELKAMTYKDFVKSTEVSEVFDRMARTGEPVKAFVLEVLRKDGQTRIVEMSSTPIRDVSGRITGARGIVRDVTEREKTHEERRRFQEFMESVEDPCFETDLRGNFTYVNEAQCKTLGYSLAELQTIRFVDYAPPEEAKKVSRAFGKLFRTGEPVAALRHGIIRKDGQARTLEVSATAIRDGSGNIVGTRGISRDVTEREKSYDERKRFQEFLDSVTDGCWETDLQGRFLYFNDAHCKNLGYSADEMKQITFKDFSSPHESQKVLDVFSRMFRTGEPIIGLEREIIRKDGHVRILETSATAVRDWSGKIIGTRGIARDVTERVKAQEEQKRSQEFLENIEDCCYEMDLEGHYIYSNEAHRKLFGYTTTDLAKFHYEDYISDEDSKKTVNAFLHMYKTGEPIKDFVREVLTRDGRIRTMELSATPILDKSGKIIGGRCIARDVTERKKTESEQERYRVFLESVDDCCWEVDLAGQVTFCNEATASRLGYTRDEYIKIPRDKRMPPEAHNDLTRLFKEMYRTGLPITGKVLPYLHKEGGIVFMDVSVSIIRDEKGNAVGARGISRDVTDRKKMEEQLTQAQKMEAIGTLAGGIAHDFNNILMGIQGYASLMLLETDQYHPNYEKLKAIETQVQNAANLTRQLLGYAQGGRYEVKLTDMNVLIDQTASLFSRTKKELSIRKRFTAGLWPVEVDRGQLEQSLLNIMINAWQAMPGGGSIYLETSNVTLDEAYVSAYDIPAGPYVKISITDTGVGMDEQTRQRIFDPFFTTKGMGKGAGLGMASVYGIIRGHNGITNVYSEKGRGTTFTIYLPSSLKEEKPALQSRRRAETAGGQKTILLVDDEKVITEVTGAMLSGLGYNVMIAGSGEEAVELYRTHQDVIDVVIMDMIMPGVGGGTAIDRIHAVNQDARIILSSGYSLNGEAQEIMDRGGPRAFLQKPFLMDELSRKIKDILAS